MPNWFYVITGGGIGALGRYVLGNWINKKWIDSALPLGTLGVNIIGCLIIGILAGVMENRHDATSASRHFLLVGLMGGFTTYSSFGLETLNLLFEGNIGSAFTHMGLHFTLGLFAVWLGWMVSKQLHWA